MHDGVPELIAVWVQPARRGTGAADALVEAVAEPAQPVPGNPSLTEVEMERLLR